ncbi:MAG: carbohydrate ABC transporter permease [Ktedonobacteraceae bacterium]
MIVKWRLQRLRRLWTARVVLGICILVVLLPLAYMLGMSFKPEREIFAHPLAPLAFPSSLENYQRVWHDLPILLYLGNSLAFSLGVTLGQIAIAVPAAFAFSNYRFKGQRLLFALVLSSLTIPFVVTYIPNYLLLSSWGLLNTLPGAILPQIASGYGIFLLRQHFKTFPVSIREAALIDGASDWTLLWRIVVPVTWGPIVALAVYIFITTWNEYIWPLLVLNANGAQTLTVAIQNYAATEGGSIWGAFMAAAAIATLPVLLLYLIMQRQILKTFIEGAVKG